MIAFIVFTSLLCTGVFITTWEGMIFHHVAKWYDGLVDCSKKKCSKITPLLKFMRNPLFGCMYCMASFWTFISWIFNAFPFPFYQLPFYMLAVCGCNAVVFAVIRFTVPGYRRY